MKKQEINFDVLFVYDSLSKLAKKALHYIYKKESITCSYTQLSSYIGIDCGSYANFVKACKTLAGLKLIRIIKMGEIYNFKINPKLKDRLCYISVKYKDGDKKIIKLLSNKY